MIHYGISNSIVTRGLSATHRHHLVTRGFLVTFINRIIKHGRSALKYMYDRTDEFVVYARIVSVNSKQPEEKIEGSIRVLFDYTKHFAIRITKVAHNIISKGIDEIIIYVNRVK
jgi:hypothetical protein